jgi:Tol biopolymer transport system component
LSRAEDRAFYPEFLPGGKAVLFSIKGFQNPDYGQIAVLSLATGKRHVVLEGGTDPRYAASGHIVFARAGAILAAPFDLSRLEVTGPAVTLIEGIRIEEWGAAQFALSTEGTLVYVSGGPAWIGKLTWVDHQGISTPLAAAAQAYGPISLSPDGQRLAVTVVGATSDVWVYELRRGTFTRLTVEGSNYVPVWTSDGRRIVYLRSSGANQFQMVWQLADGSGAEEVLTTCDYRCWPACLSPDGRLLAFHQSDPDTGVDLSILPLEGGRQPYSWLKTKFNEWGATFSRDGKWIAYTSDESGQYEIYVRSFPDSGGKRQISNAGGEEVTWSPDGRTLFYREGLKWMSVAVETRPEFRAAAPKRMFEGPYLNVPGVSYDVAPDGQHFVMIEENQKQAPTTELNVVLNWFEELNRLVPPGERR